MTTTLCSLLSDKFLFPLLQAVLVLFVLFSGLRDWIAYKRAGRGGVTLQITRSDASMNLFYGTYAALNGLLVAICVSVDVAKDYRVLWVILDTIAVVYVCLFNGWFRNYVVRFANYLRELEKR
jgi:hypothetical protein